MAVVYILYSTTEDKFYTGSCKDFPERLSQHQNKTFEKSYTGNSDDWEIFLYWNDLEYEQARLIEQHIKKMKSKTYILNLKTYPEIFQKLKEKYKVTGSSR